MAPITLSAQTTLHPPNLTDPSILRVRDTVHQIKVLTDRIVHLQSQSQSSEDEEIQVQLATDQKKLANLKIMLRGFNREMYLENRSVKTATSEAKAQVDNLYLTLQNLKYEQQHLRSEIQDCRNYVYPSQSLYLEDKLMGRTLHTELDLVSEEEFLVLHPEYSGLEGHELMLKRLQDEADQRVELETRRKDLVNRRTATQADSKKRKNDLDNLTETLKKFIEVPDWDLSR
jgi:THO complex subunit 5